ncbi:MAG: ABC transporter permease, partial [Pseudomonadota bacterium]
MVDFRTTTALSPLQKKLLRDLWRLRGQVLAIAFVIASGTATLVMSLSTIYALEKTSTAYYQQYRFADIFADLTRAPNQIAKRIRAIDGVQTVHTRIVKHATADIDNFVEPVIGQLVSIPESKQPELNQLAMRAGRWIEPGREDEVILSEPFAESHNLRLGDQIQLIMQGIKRRFTVVGIALSPEFIYSLPPGGLLPDAKRFGVIWVSHQVM